MAEKSELDRACEKHEITASATHKRFESDPEWTYDVWEVTLCKKDRRMTVEFKTGTGHRTLEWGVKREGRGYYSSNGRSARTDAEAVRMGMLVLPKVKDENGKHHVMGPSAADVLYCLLSDVDACETSFEDWASNFGYDSDSIKAQTVYFACQKNGDKLRKLLGSAELLTELRGKEH